MKEKGEGGSEGTEVRVKVRAPGVARVEAVLLA